MANPIVHKTMLSITLISVW